jgi:hypothetical protein
MQRTWRLTIATDAVTTAKILDGTIHDIADAVTTAKMPMLM